jgi:AraC-like DNA-binding protein
LLADCAKRSDPNLCDCDLTVAAVAQRQGVRPRYIHKPFESEGLAFSNYVLGQRRMPSDSGVSDCRISSIAFDVGFSDFSDFNRAFRRRYDATPSDIRRSGQRSHPPRAQPDVP